MNSVYTHKFLKAFASELARQNLFGLYFGEGKNHAWLLLLFEPEKTIIKMHVLKFCFLIVIPFNYALSI